MIRRALKDTGGPLGINRSTVLKLLAMVPIGFVVPRVLANQSQATSAFIAWIATVAIPLIVIAVLIFLWNVFLYENNVLDER